MTNIDLSGLDSLQTLDCWNNQLTTLDAKGLNNLKYLNCYENYLSNLNVINLRNLEQLYCYSNSLTNLDLIGLNNLKTLSCFSNNISNLDLDSISSLQMLFCHNNNLPNLYVNNLNNLEILNCANNNISNLDVSGLSNLIWLFCYNNNLSTSSLDHLYCSLYNRQAQTYSGIIVPINDSSSNYLPTLIASNKQNAINKNWLVKYFESNEDIPATIGTYSCNNSIEGINNDSIIIKFYPNPFKQNITIEANENIKKIYVFNILGKVELTKEINKNSTTLDLTLINKGAHIIKIFTSEGEKSFTVIKE